MKVTLKLFALLGRYLPPGSAANATTLEVEDATAITGLVTRFGLADKDCHLVLLNGNFIPIDARAHTMLAEGDVVSIWPPIGGG